MAHPADDSPLVRPPTLADAERIADLHVRSWQVAYRGLLSDRYLDGLSFETASRTEQWRLRIAQPESVTLVVEIDGVVAGWASFGANRDEDVSDDAVGEIWGIYVDPELWRRQAGTALMARVLEEMVAAGYAEATLWVLEGNRRARRFYERFAWRPDGATEWFERDGSRVIEIRYRRPLTAGDP
jgi:ribosomal protein S18 acetylase RimI-like enzyme